MTESGRKEATVFTGFCGYHDNELFKPIENNEFDNSDEHIFLYIYRAFALEYHRKQENIKLQQLILRKWPSLMGNNEIDNMFMSKRLAVSDLDRCKKVFDQTIIDKNYEIFTFNLSKPY